MNINVLTAVFKRNFFSYFSNPTGYVFICVFVFLSAIAAFWPDEFFIANLANLDQLNKYFSFIMLFFVPAITMGIWAEETRQGTDELLLTMPATDFDIVLGKYFAAVSIYTVALLISMASNFAVLSTLGRPDVGLYLCTHFGYWLLGLSMLAIGMVASFLTRNLTVAYILGALFNAPLVLMARIDVIPGLTHNLAVAVRKWSLGGQCQEFGQGVLALSGVIYFLFIAAIMLYACIVLIGRRHWARGDDTGLQSGHYLVRAMALAVIGAAVVYTVQNHDARRDVTSEQLSTLSPFSVQLLKELKDDYATAADLQPKISKLEYVVKTQEQEEKKSAAKAASAPKSSASASPAPKASATAAAKPVDPKNDKKPDPKDSAAKGTGAPPAPLTADAKELKKLKEQFEKLKVQGPVRIDAFISTEVPESYLQTRINLLADLREFKAKAGPMVELDINDMTHGDPQLQALSKVAKTRYNIVPKEIFYDHAGALKKDSIYLGVAFTCGLEKFVLPFVDKGLPAEYELIRSLCTVTRQKRKRVGVLETDAHVMGNFTGQGMSPSWRLIEELQKQYEVVSVSPAELSAPPAPGDKEKHYNVLLAIQPSAMGPKELDSLVAAIRRGQPTVIFEDPLPFSMQGIPGTYQPRQPQQNMMMGFNRENQEKGEIRALWRLLGIDVSDGGDGDEFNPMAGPQISSGREKIVWQRYNPYPRYGDAILPEWVFIDHSCGAKDPFNDKDEKGRDRDEKDVDPISSKLQKMFFPVPGFIEDTPEIVKRVIAKWHNAQYAKLLADKIRKLEGDVQSQGDEAKRLELEKSLAKAKVESDRLSTGEAGEKTLQPDKISEDAKLTDLLKDLDVAGDISRLSDLRRDLRNRFPVRAVGEGISEMDAERIESLEPNDLRLDASKLKEDAARIAREAGQLSGEAAKARRHDAQVSEENAKLEEAMARLKDSLAQAETVKDAIQYAKGVLDLQIKDRSFVPLVQSSSDSAGTEPAGKFILRIPGEGEMISPFRTLNYQQSNGQQYILAAHIQGKPVGVKGASGPLNVVLVADIDMIGDQLFKWREQGKLPGQDVDFDFDNVTFVLNALDSLAGDDRFLELRKRGHQHRTLEGFEEHTKEAHKETAKARKEKNIEHDDTIRKAIEELKTKEEELRREVGRPGADVAAIEVKKAIIERTLNRKIEEQREDSDHKYNEAMRTIAEEQETKIQGLQGAYKFWAVVIPPIPPLLVAALVYFNRRTKEREGVSSKRLR
jgi:hypothetical protein